MIGCFVAVCRLEQDIIDGIEYENEVGNGTWTSTVMVTCMDMVIHKYITLGRSRVI